MTVPNGQMDSEGQDFTIGLLFAAALRAWFSAGVSGDQ
jgi:hypothetical protein